MNQPRCRHFPQCGGCSFQDIPYEDQLRAKGAHLQTIYQHHAPALKTPLPAKTPFAYRNKMEFTFSQDKARNHYLGLYMKRRRVLDLSECHLTPPWFVDALYRTRAWWKESGLHAYHPPSNTGSLRTLTLREGRRTGQKMAVLTVSGVSQYALTKDHLSAFLKALTPIDPTLSLFIRIQTLIKGQPTQFFEHNIHGPDHITEILTVAGRPLTFKISPSSFFQPNTEQAELIYNTAADLLPSTPLNTLYDLYCGTGTLGMALSPRFQTVLGIELCPYSVFDARANAAHNHLSNIHIHHGDVAALLPTLLQDHPADVAIVDPPRPGLDPAALNHLLTLAPKHLLYISCNPTTHARDLTLLTPTYRLHTLQPIDQFPHTPHIEVIASLTRT